MSFLQRKNMFCFAKHGRSKSADKKHFQFKKKRKKFVGVLHQRSLLFYQIFDLINQIKRSFKNRPKLCFFGYRRPSTLVDIHDHLLRYKKD
jgi:hypothetical protein